MAREPKAPPTDRRLLMLAGAAGGVGAIFRAPLGARYLPARFFIRLPHLSLPLFCRVLPAQLWLIPHSRCSLHHSQFLTFPK